MSDREGLQTLSRGLKALAFLNENGLTNLATLARHLAVPRANAYRIVNTLIADGYCTRIPNSRFYQASPKTWLLSKGVQEGEILTSVAIGVVERLGEAVKWPVTLATPHDNGMLVRVTTDRTSSLALARIAPGYLANMLRTTTGLLYLSLVAEEVREPLIETLMRQSASEEVPLNRGRIETLLALCRADGYLILDTSFPEGCVGVPIVVDNRPIGGLVMRYIKSAVSERTIRETYLPQLLGAAGEMVRLHRLAIEGAPSRA